MSNSIAPPSAPASVVRGIYAAIAVGDIEAAAQAMAPDICFTQSMALPFGGAWIGHDGFRRMGAAIYAAWPDFAVTTLAFLSDGETVLVLTHLHGALSSATPLDQPMIERWRVVGGQAVECQPFYFDQTAAVASLS
ncbi:nuclear transport factor 2 family protein (plasmid) [Rhizobium sp. WL3]|uniref:nuclear transport factor 2 family protein n=1 Tax=Rhizobium sp. WL3 TaxID=2603277 RepID=UPI0011C206A7|nr:nuclear transport factor 2 family protein [Rhizobium sp. WL3]QEE43476.1 nuclear transport factor 2 family protein [Rhizobium sp. WL3]